MVSTDDDNDDFGENHNPVSVFSMKCKHQEGKIKKFQEPFLKIVLSSPLGLTFMRLKIL